ncbi:MAG: membrane dipeptidase [Hyphomicrobiaceae bacterium]
MDRRHIIKSGLALPFAWMTRAMAEEPVFIGDMHAHFFLRDGRHKTTPIGESMAKAKATLVAWSISGDALWIGEVKGRGFVQKSVPKPGETFGWFQRELHRIKSLLVEQNLKIARTARDVELAVNGEPHVVLAVEGANFIEGDIGRVKVAYDLGVRHLQLVHYSRNTLGDYQTIEPEHGGLTDLGKKVVQECNRLGILIDLAHSTSNSVAQALSLSRVPIVWSHSSVTSGEPHWSMIGWKARQLRFADAKAIASKGGVVGLWALRQDMGRSLDGYADRLSALATQLGDSHVAFGSDMNGLGRSALVNEFSDLRTVVDRWRTQGMSSERLHKLAIGNYARVLRETIG